jgi:hypothetical protein
MSGLIVFWLFRSPSSRHCGMMALMCAGRWSIVAAMASALASGGCGGRAESDRETTEAPSRCARLCALGASCGFTSAQCQSECAWLDGSPGFPGCPESIDTMLGCVESEPERLRCNEDGVTVTLSGCSAQRTWACVTNFEFGGVELALADAAAATCREEPLQIQVGSADPGPGDEPLFDASAVFINELHLDEAHFTDNSLRCDVVVRDGGFDFDLRLRRGDTTFEAKGFLDPAGVGSGRIAYQSSLSSPALSSAAEAPCEVIANYEANRHAPAIREDGIWAEFRCELLNGASNDSGCSAEGTFLVNFCSSY